MAAMVHVRTVQFLDAGAADDDDGGECGGLPSQPQSRKQSEPNARLTYRSDDSSETWFKDNRLGHRQQAAYLLRLERLRQDLHDTEQGRLRDSLDRLLSLRAPSKAADALASPPTFAAAAAATERRTAVAAALVDRRAPWLARSPEEHALLASVRDEARSVHTRQRTSEPPMPTVKRLLAAAAARSAKKASTAPPPSHDTATAGAGSGKENALANAHAPQALSFLRDEPAAAAAPSGSVRGSPPCAPTIPTLNRSPTKFGATAGSSESIDARGRCSRTAPAGGSGSCRQRRAKLMKRGSLARAVTAIKAASGERQQQDASSLVVPGKRMLATPAAAAYGYSASSTPREDDVAPIELFAESEAGLRVVMPDPGARTMSRSTDVKCESAMQRHDRDDHAQRARSVAFVENPA